MQIPTYVANFVVAFARGFEATFPAPSVRFAAHRFFNAATIFRLPAADNFRLGFLESALAVSLDAAFVSAQRRFWAAAIARRPAALMLRFRG